ncbi:MAG: LysM peptidoglycan-binding domain-containing protein [Spirochaetaceae bacterium]|jgi:phage tail protein X|nr:LysM peptidoglycan-binding domain-containing protein [Spirochaetaceae bacterium]
MKRRTSLISLLLLLILCIISCTSTQKAVENPEPAGASESAKAPDPVVKDNAPPAVPQGRSSALILENARRHRVVWGDTLSSLSKKYYGPANGYYFPVIMLASGGVVSNPDVIAPGMILTIPDLNKNLADPQARSKIKSYLKDTARLYERKRDLKTRNSLIQLADSL